MAKKYLQIVDPIHDFITIHKNELDIIDTPVFQRLRRIRQLAGAHLVYPGAQHSRFEHSLGAMHIANQAATILKEKKFLDSEDVTNLRLAALLHDIGHGPFSHLFEEVLQKKKRISHEEIGARLILKSEIGDLITKAGFDKGFVSKLAFGNSKYQFMNEIISGGLSADMVDYLLRDGYFTGAEHAKVDFMRIINSLDVHNRKLSLDRSALYSFESMMISRYQMFKAVYFHKTVRAAEVMLLEAMLLADNELNLTDTSLDNYLNLTDDSTLEKIHSLNKSNEVAVRLVTDYRNRKLLKCVYEKFLHKHNGIFRKMDRQALNNLASQIAESARVHENSVFVDASRASSMPLTPTKKEIRSILLVDKE